MNSACRKKLLDGAVGCIRAMKWHAAMLLYSEATCGMHCNQHIGLLRVLGEGAELPVHGECHQLHGCPQLGRMQAPLLPSRLGQGGFLQGNKCAFLSMDIRL